MTASPTLFDYAARRDAALTQVAENAGAEFIRKAQVFVSRYLETHGETDGETLTDECKAAGIVPESGDRAFGAVIGGLSRRGVIERCGMTTRRKGNLTAGNSIWKLA